MILKVKYYRVYNLTRKIELDCRTLEEARYCIKEDDAIRRKKWRNINDGSGILKPYEPSKFLIQEMVGAVESEAIKDWHEGDYSEEVEFGGLIIKTRNKNKEQWIGR